MDSLERLTAYVVRHTERGPCRCGECIDRPLDAVQPEGHTADLIFYKVGRKGAPDPDEFRALARELAPHWFDGAEHNYIHMGGDIGAQEVALRCMGLGALLGVWDLLTPVTVFGPAAEDLPAPVIIKMAQAGYVAIIVRNGGGRR
jgi:hypothetical protein